MALQSERERTILIALAVLAVLALLYSIFIARAPLVWTGIVVPLVFVYLVWRFVRAHERMAEALESIAGNRSAEVLVEDDAGAK